MEYSAIEKYNNNDHIVNWKEKAPQNVFSDNQFIYNQKLVSKMCCTATAWLTAFTNNFWIEAIETLALKTIWEDCKTNWWATEEKGGRIYKAVDEVRRYYRALWYDIETKRVVNLSDDFFKLLDLWYVIHTWIIAWWSFYKDAQDDWEINTIKHTGNTYWHSICIIKEDNNYYIIDNYNWDHTHNKILVTREWLRGGELFKQGYIYINYGLQTWRLKEKLTWISIFKKAKILAWVIKNYWKDSKAYKKLLEVFKN